MKLHGNLSAYPSFRLMPNRSTRLPNSVGSFSGCGCRTCSRAPRLTNTHNTRLVAEIRKWMSSIPRLTQQSGYPLPVFAEPCTKNVHAYSCLWPERRHTRTIHYERCLTSLSVSTMVTSAQKLLMDSAIVLPKNPSDGFPINPTLQTRQEICPNTRALLVSLKARNWELPVSCK